MPLNILFIYIEARYIHEVECVAAVQREKFRSSMREVPEGGRKKEAKFVSEKGVSSIEMYWIWLA